MSRDRGLYYPDIAKPRKPTVDGSEIPNNHLGCKRPFVNTGKKLPYQQQYQGATLLDQG